MINIMRMYLIKFLTKINTMKYSNTKLIFILSVFLSFESQGNVISDDTLRLSRNVLFKKIYQWNSQQSYLTPPTIVHFGGNPTYRNYILNSTIQPHYFLALNSYSRWSFEFFSNIDLRLNWGNDYSPRYDTKLGWNFSSPVRTPSLRAGGALYIPLPITNKDNIKRLLENQKINLNTNSETINVLKPASVYNYQYLKFVALHHSNGQDGDHDDATMTRIFSTLGNRPYDYRKYTGTGLPPYLKDREFNIYNGNFANDVVFQLFYNWGGYKLGEERFWMSEGKIFDSYALTNGEKHINHIHKQDKITNFEVGIHYVPLRLVGEEKLIGRYGLTKLMFKYQLINATHYNVNGVKIKDRLPDSRYERDRLIIDFSLAINRFNNLTDNNYIKAIKRINFEAKYQLNNFGSKKNLFKSNSTSPYISFGWKGQDDYNIFLEDRFFFLKMGLALGHKIYDDKRIAFVDSKLDGIKRK